MTEQQVSEPQSGQHAVILCHPDPKSFNHAVAHSYCNAVRKAGQHVVVRDLYALEFDPVLKAAERPTLAHPVQSQDVKAELASIAGSDVFVLIYPIWFGSPPALLKGYIERVFGSDVTPEAIQRKKRTPLLGGKRLLSFTTSASSDIWLDAQGQENAMRTVVDQYLMHAFGMHSQEHKQFSHITPSLSQRFADQYLHDVTLQAQRTCAQVACGDEALLRAPRLVH